MSRQDIQKSINDAEGLPGLFAKMADDLTKLLDAKLALLKIELKEELSAYLRGGVMIIAGGVLGLIGFAVLNVAIASFIASLFSKTTLSIQVQYGLGFLITALLYLIGGGVLILVYKNRLAEQDIAPRTTEELRLDKERLEEEI